MTEKNGARRQKRVQVWEKTPMSVQSPAERIRNFNEVALGYSLEQAKQEAERCIQCKIAWCEEGCPVRVPIKDFCRLITEDKLEEAIRIIKEVNSLPAVCGRVCPQEEQCEIKCVVAKRGEPVAIGRLERFVADFELGLGDNGVKPVKPLEDAPKVAVVGAGPAGLTAAGDLARMGYRVTVFEALHEAGGVLMYGIPEFRLPKEIVRAEINKLREMGVEILTNAVVGKVVTIDELFEQGYEAVFVGTGAGLPRFMGIPGENLNGIYSANEFLTRVNLMRAYLFPEFDTPVKIGKKVAVIGAGNTAMDAVRTALRLGAEEAHIVYRRSEKEMTARVEEYHHAIDEGVIFNWLTNPVRYLGNEEGWVTGMECVHMELGPPDESGRRRPVPIQGSEFVIDVDTVVLALGTSPNPLLTSATPGLDTKSWGGIVADEETGATSREGVYAGGDVVTGAATVILAMGAGKKAAEAMHEYIKSKGRAPKKSVS